MVADTTRLPRVRADRVRLPALRMPIIPITLVAQLGGGVATLAGVYLWLGLAATLIVGGISAVILGALREAGRI